MGSGGIVPGRGRPLSERRRPGTADPAPPRREGEEREGEERESEEREGEEREVRAGVDGPVSLTVEQTGGDPVQRPARAVAVLAWIPWTDGRYHAVEAFAGEWTSRAVHLRWREGPGRLHDVWVWAAGVRRRE